MQNLTTFPSSSSGGLPPLNRLPISPFFDTSEPLPPYQQRHESSVSMGSGPSIGPKTDEEQPKYRIKLVMKKRKRRSTETDEEEEVELRSHSKTENKLGPTAVKFLDRLKAQNGRPMDLNEARRDLNVPKRRIYDITNVLEGLGMVVKSDKNTVVIGGLQTSYLVEPEGRAMAKQYELLGEEERRLDVALEKISHFIQSCYSRGIYLQKTDVKFSTEGSTILIQAPFGTSKLTTRDPLSTHPHILRLTLPPQSNSSILVNFLQQHFQDTISQADSHPSYQFTTQLNNASGTASSVPMSSHSPPLPGNHPTNVSNASSSYQSGTDTTPSRSTFSTPTRYHHSSLELSTPNESRFAMSLLESPARSFNSPTHHNSSYFDLLSPTLSRYPPVASPAQFPVLTPYPDEPEWKDPELPSLRNMFKDWPS